MLGRYDSFVDQENYESLTGGNGGVARSSRFRFQNRGYEGLLLYVPHMYSERGRLVTGDVKFGVASCMNGDWNNY